ncbi:arsenate reductase [Umbelopsis sp. PMI_123]|nr:arsenate reductase [Umbelopsis sp. PMI_123]
MSSSKGPSVLFVCRHNSCRSQMAEGFGRHLFGSESGLPFFSRVESAALEGQSIVNPEAIKTMKNLQIDITSQSSKMIDTFSPSDFSVIISMCGCGATVPDHWKEGKRFEDWNVTDPTGGSDQDFEVARNEIGDRVKELVASIKEDRAPTYTLYYGDVCAMPSKPKSS